MFRVASRTKFSEPRDDCVGLLKLYGNEMVLVQTSMFLNERSKFSNRIIPGFTCLAIPKNKLVTLSNIQISYFFFCLLVHSPVKFSVFTF